MHEYLAVFYIPNLEKEMINYRIKNSWGPLIMMIWAEKRNEPL